MSFDPQDFVALMSCADRTETERLCRKIFSSVDTDGSGFIEKTEMFTMMKTYITFFTQKTHKDTPADDEIAKIAEESLTEMDKMPTERSPYRNSSTFNT